MLAVTFFSSVPRLFWKNTFDETKLAHAQHTQLLLTLWRNCCDTAIQCQINILTAEQLEQNKSTSSRKQQKINGLQLLKSEIQLTSPEFLTRAITHSKKNYPKLTTGFFSNRTQLLLETLEKTASFFYEADITHDRSRIAAQKM